MISDEQGRHLVRLARSAVTAFLSKGNLKEPISDIDLSSGVFVTLNFLNSRREEQLRGCIGSVVPYKKIEQAVIDYSIAAATEDPRFPPIDLKELPNIIFELSILSAPVEIMGTPDEMLKAIKIGQDGLILKWKHGSGLLLPQVPVELHWDVDRFMANVCHKAAAPPDVLRDPSSKVYTFQATIFKELTPGGDSVRVEL